MAGSLGGTGGRGGSGGRGGAGGSINKPGLPGQPGLKGEAGEPGQQGERGQQGKSGYVWQLLPYLIVFAVGVFSFYSSEDAKDQVCLVFERTYTTEIDSLARTYDYLQRQPVSEFDSNLNEAILRGLKGTELRLMVERPPDFCANGSTFHGSLGLDEPVPDIPERPIKIDRYLLNQ